MKKNLLIVMLMALLAIPANAQFRWGLEAGLNFNSLSISNITSNTKTGFFVGPKVQFGIAGTGLSFDGSAQYWQNYAEVENTSSKSLPYIVIPVNIKYAFGLGSVAAIYISTGPQWNWYVGSKYTYDNGIELEPKTSSMNWNVGLGVHRINHLHSCVTDSIGLGNNISFNELSAGKVIDNISGKSNVWQVRFAYMF